MIARWMTADEAAQCAREAFELLQAFELASAAAQPVQEVDEAQALADDQVGPDEDLQQLQEVFHTVLGLRSHRLAHPGGFEWAPHEVERLRQAGTVPWWRP